MHRDFPVGRQDFGRASYKWDEYIQYVSGSGLYSLGSNPLLLGSIKIVICR